MCACMCIGGLVCKCVHVCVHACVYVHACVCVCVCAHVHMCVCNSKLMLGVMPSFITLYIKHQGRASHLKL